MAVWTCACACLAALRVWGQRCRAHARRDAQPGRPARTPPPCCAAHAVGSSAGPEGSIRWPLFKWAGGGDDKYFARLAKGAIKV
jgi:hypothetical protein